MKALEKILELISKEHPEIYKEYLYEIHELKYGPHFTEDTAKDSVNKMYHHLNGTLCKGEHWTIDKIKELKENYKLYIADTVTYWDLYVALHMWWHDLEVNYKKHGIPESYLIEDAITWAFIDEDAPDGKIWYYIKAMLK